MTDDKKGGGNHFRRQLYFLDIITDKFRIGFTEYYMYKEQLKKYAVSNEYVKLSKGADGYSVSKAEKGTGYTFPSELKTLLSETDGDGYLFLSADEIIETNQRLRAFIRECYEDDEKLLFFAQNGCGDYYCYKILKSNHADESRIYIWLHEDNELMPVAGNIKEFIDRYFNSEI